MGYETLRGRGGVTELKKTVKITPRKEIPSYFKSMSLDLAEQRNYFVGRRRAVGFRLSRDSP